MEAMEAVDAARVVIMIMALLLSGGAVGWAIRDHKAEADEVIDLRDRIEPHVRAPLVEDEEFAGRR